MKISDFKDIVSVCGHSYTGTSCTADLLRALGFNLGIKRDVTQKGRPIACGYYENLLIYAINMNALTASRPKGDKMIAKQETILRQMKYRKPYIKKFNEYFQGNLVKEPRLALTLRAWMNYCPRMKYWIFTVRDPFASATSYAEYQQTTFEEGLTRWTRYYDAILDNIHKIDRSSYFNYYLLDYDKYGENVAEQLHNALKKFSFNIELSEVKEKIKGIYKEGERHRERAKMEDKDLPNETVQIYEELLFRMEEQ